MAKSKKIQTNTIEPEQPQIGPQEQLEIPNNTLSYLNEGVVYDLPPVTESAPHPYEKQILAWRRDNYNFLPIEYKFKDDNTIDWAAMIPKKFFVPNKEKFPEGTDFSSLKIEDLRDDQLLLLLAGVRYVGKLAGIKSVKKVFPTSSREHVSCICSVEFYPDANGQSFTYDGEGDAHFGNTHDWARDFLTTIAGNRAEARAIKTGLSISFITQEEMGPSKKEKEVEKSVNSSITDPISTLKNLLAKENVSFESFKKVMIAAKFVDASFNDIDEFPREHVFEAIGIVKIKVAERKAAK